MALSTMRRAFVLLSVCLLVHATAEAGTKRAADNAYRKDWAKRWIRISSNLHKEGQVQNVAAYMRRAAKVGYNGVHFTGSNIYNWWNSSDPARYEANVRRIRALARELKLEFVPAVFPYGHANSLLYNAPNLASGLPLKDALMVARNGVLVPEQTAQIRNGSFEKYSDHAAEDFNQDAAGKVSFIDTQVSRTGRASLRIENAESEGPHVKAGRFWQTIEVKPFQQYRISMWVKMERLTAGSLLISPYGADGPLWFQHLRFGPWSWGGAPRDLTKDWVEYRTAFNSLTNTRVTVYAGIWGAKQGKIWWDDLRIEAVPTLNVLRRKSLPLTVMGENGRAYEEGKDFERVVDPRLGKTETGYLGMYDVVHEPPTIKLAPNSRIREGERCRFSCYHTMVIRASQVNCSMDDPDAFELCRLQMQKVRDLFDPDGYFMQHDEIRVAGWEPSQTARFKTSGELFAFNIKRSYEIARPLASGKPIYLIQDMFDPHHNAIARHYLVQSTLEGAWDGVDKNIIMVNWNMGKGGKSLKFFADRGHKQILYAYWDRKTREDVEENYRMWSRHIEGVPGVIGTMYTTWRGNYDHIETFADVWWRADIDK